MFEFVKLKKKILKIRNKITMTKIGNKIFDFKDKSRAKKINLFSLKIVATKRPAKFLLQIAQLILRN